MDKLYNAIMGIVVGDALGVPFEFRKRDTFIASGMMGNGTHHQIAGTWSDDSSMTLATLESIVRLGRIDPADIMENFVRWFRDAEFTPWAMCSMLDQERNVRLRGSWLEIRFRNAAAEREWTTGTAR